MSRFARTLSLFAVPVLFAACSSGGTDTPLSPAGPRQDGGLTMIGGNAAPKDSTSASTTSTTSTSSDPGLNDPTATDTTSRGGLTMIGGN